ncbi:hypothetical protein [Lignipirellula cremea]|uniref:Chromosome partition protein Smc n=1 Tax=Lignipirellula cremea TaxID=2528010 RepID=A0A518DPJ9_9BACT|nr:hypothetical protein [Lignipirellula cremea]QDU93762.1 Chromosome partition protein Smc [Lignipirellula cremea]
MSHSHWTVLAVGLFFLGLQIYACCRFFLLLRGWRRIIVRLDQGDPTGGERAALGRRFSWLAWINRHFPPGEDPRGNYSRDDVMKELDSRIASNNEYVLLQRMGAMAPLLGVLLTVGSFMMLDPQPEELRELLAMFRRLAPVAAGIGVGASLALVNQWLLHFVSRAAERLRRAARDWFDTHVWDALGNRTRSSSERVMDALSELAESSRDSARQQQAGSALLVESATAIQQAGVRLEASTTAFAGQLGDLPEELTRLREATQQAVAAIGVLAPAGERVVAGIEASANAFHVAVVDQFGEAATLHHRTMADVSEAADVLRTSTRVLFNECKAMHASVRLQTESLDALNLSLQQELLPANQAFYGHVTQFNSSAEELFDRMNALYQEVADGMERLAGLTPAAAGALGALSAAVETFRHSVENDFAPASHSHREQLKTLTASLQGISTGVDNLRDSSRQLADAAASHAQYSQQLQASVADEVLPVHAQLAAAVASLAPVASQLGGQVQSLGEAISQARDEIVSAAPQVREVFHQLQPALDQFRQTLSADLPAAASEQRQAVEQLVAAASGLAGAITQIDQAGGKWHALLDSQQSAADRYLQSLQQTVLPAHQEISGGAVEFGAALTRFRELFDGALSHLAQFDPQVQQALAELTPSIAALRTTVEGDLAEAAQRQSAAVESLAGAAERLNVTADSLRQGGESLAALIQQQQALGETTSPIVASMQAAADQLQQTGVTLQQSLETDVAPAYRSMQEAAASFQGSASHLSDFMERGIDPATARLAQLDGSLARLHTLAESFQNLAGMSDQIQELSQSLRQASDVSQAIEALPEQLQAALNRLAENHSRKSWFPFLQSEKRNSKGP